MRPSIGSLEIWHGLLENLPARPRSRSKMREKNVLNLCSDQKKIESFMLEITRNAHSMIEVKTELGNIENIYTFLVVKMRKICAFHSFVQNVHKYFQIDSSICQIGVGSRYSSIMLEKCLVMLEKCSILLEKFFKTYDRDRLVLA